jgi:hypothetical protein
VCVVRASAIEKVEVVQNCFRFSSTFISGFPSSTPAEKIRTTPCRLSGRIWILRRAFIPPARNISKLTILNHQRSPAGLSQHNRCTRSKLTHLALIRSRNTFVISHDASNGQICQPMFWQIVRERFLRFVRNCTRLLLRNRHRR